MKKQFIQNDNNMAVAYYRFSSHAQNEQSIDRHSFEDDETRRMIFE